MALCRNCAADIGKPPFRRREEWLCAECYYVNLAQVSNGLTLNQVGVHHTEVDLRLDADDSAWQANERRVLAQPAYVPGIRLLLASPLCPCSQMALCEILAVIGTADSMRLLMEAHTGFQPPIRKRRHAVLTSLLVVTIATWTLAIGLAMFSSRSAMFPVYAGGLIVVGGCCALAWYRLLPDLKRTVQGTEPLLEQASALPALIEWHTAVPRDTLVNSSLLSALRRVEQEDVCGLPETTREAILRLIRSANSNIAFAALRHVAGFGGREALPVVLQMMRIHLGDPGFKERLRDALVRKQYHLADSVAHQARESAGEQATILADAWFAVRARASLQEQGSGLLRAAVREVRHDLLRRPGEEVDHERLLRAE